MVVVLADVFGVEVVLFPFPNTICITVFMTVKICCKHFRRGVDVCSLGVDLILKLTRGFL